MLSSPWTQSEPRHGILYVTFDDNGIIEAGEPIVDAPKNTTKKEAGTDDKISELALAEHEESQISECVYEPEAEYGVR